MHCPFFNCLEEWEFANTSLNASDASAVFLQDGALDGANEEGEESDEQHGFRCFVVLLCCDEASGVNMFMICFSIQKTGGVWWGQKISRSLKFPKQITKI